MLRIKAPGKLMLLGEWAILEPGNHCIVAAIDKYVTAMIEKKDFGITFNLPHIALPLIQGEYADNRLSITTPLTHAQEKAFAMCRAAAETALEYVKQPLPISLTLTSDISTITLANGTRHKLGFGSSAATVVATIKAIFAIHGLNIDNPKNLERIFKLSVIAHNIAQGNGGSGFDIAAATYGTTLLYQRFDPNWLEKQLLKPRNNLVAQPWPGLRITQFRLPPHLIILVGFSGKSASTSALIGAMATAKHKNPDGYQMICTAINQLVVNTTGDAPSLIAAVAANRKLLLELEQIANITLETPELNTLITIAQHHGATAKFSGAGTGDCGIALCTDPTAAETITRNWLSAGIMPIDIKFL